MAENLLSNGYPILHTYSKYATENIDLNFLSGLRHTGGISQEYKNVKAREEALYKKYGAKTFEEFRDKIKKIFNSQDLPIIQKFAAENISQELSKFALQNHDLYEYKEGIKIIIDTSKIQNINGLSLVPENKGKGARKQLKQNKNGDLELTLSGEVEVEKLKATMNEIFGKRYHTSTTSTQYLDRFITSLTSEDGPLTIKIGKKTKQGNVTYTDEYVRHSIPNFPWGVTKKMWEQAVKDGNRAILNEMEKATKRIFSFLVEDLGRGASANLHQAIINVWNSICGKDFGQARFFSGGTSTNFISGVQGALGEFQTALLFEYLTLQGATSAFAEIKGSTTVGAFEEKARSDVEIFKSIGIQVKNFTEIQREVNGNKKTSFIHSIHTRTHPIKLAEHFDLKYRTNFLSFMANFYFNATYEKQNFGNMVELKYILQQWLGAVMNMAVNDAAITDTVTFYMISGKYFVPCSVILKASREIGLKQSVKIYGADNGVSDKGFARQENGKPLFQTYWEKDNNTWKPTTGAKSNESESKNLLEKSISIQTQFDFFEEIEKYALW